MAQKTKKPQSSNNDSTYIFKLVLFLIIGVQWLRLTTSSGQSWPLPIGLAIGVAFAAHEHFRIDRKIEYAVLLIAAAIGFWSQIGLSILVR